MDAPDHTIFDYAARDDRIVVSADTDFGELLARRDTPRPSLILLRRRTRRRPSDQSVLLLTQLPAVASDLEAGAIVVIEEARVRGLPIGQHSAHRTHNWTVRTAAWVADRLANDLRAASAGRLYVNQS